MKTKRNRLLSNQTEWQPNVPKWFREQQEPPHEPAPPSALPKIVLAALMIVLALTAWVASLRLYGQAQYQRGVAAGGRSCGKSLSEFSAEHLGQVVAFPINAEQLQYWLDRDRNSEINVYFGAGQTLFPRQPIRVQGKRGIAFKNLDIDARLLPEREPVFHLRDTEGISVEGGTVRREK